MLALQVGGEVSWEVEVQLCLMLTQDSFASHCVNTHQMSQPASLTSTLLGETEAQRRKNRKLVTAELHSLYPRPQPSPLLCHLHQPSTLSSRRGLFTPLAESHLLRAHLWGQRPSLCPSSQASLLIKKLTSNNGTMADSIPCFKHTLASQVPLAAMDRERSLLLPFHR